MSQSSEPDGELASDTVVLLPGHSQEALVLSAAAGWNQSGDDWNVMLQHGTGVGRRTSGGRLVASIVSLPYGDVVWLSMLLTLPEFRGVGIGTQLFVSALQTVRESARIAALDATPLGLPIYQQHGFAPLMILRRMELQTARRASATADAAGIQPVAPDRVESIADLDTTVVGLNRGWLIRALSQQSNNTMLTDTDDAGSFLLLRHGRIACQLGPVYAGSTATAVRLTKAAMVAAAGRPLFVDVLTEQTDYLDWLASIGFREQRIFTRMAKAQPALQGRRDMLFAITGPEFG